MTFKKSILFALSAILMLSLISLASAISLSSFNIGAPSSVSHTASSFPINFTLTNSGEPGTVVLTSLMTSGTATISLESSTISMGNGSSSPVSVTITGTVSFSQYQSGTFAGTITADPSGSGSNQSDSFSVSITPSSSFTITDAALTRNQNSSSITVQNTGNTVLSNIQFSTNGDNNVSLSPNPISSLNSGSSTIVNVNSLVDFNSLSLGKHNVLISATAGSTNVNGTVTLSKDFCDDGNINDSKIKIYNIEDKSSDDEWEWKPLDNVEIEVEIENRVGEDEDFTVELGLYDTVKAKFIDLDGDKTLENDLSIDDDDSEQTTFEFQVPSDLEESNGRYKIYVKAYVDGDEDVYCNSYDASDVPDSSVDPIRIEKDNNEIVLSELSATNIVGPGQTVTVSARAFNIGNDDEDRVKVSLSNLKFGLDIDSSSFELDSGDSNFVDFSFVVPDNAENGIYYLRLVSYYDYKKSSDFYSKSSDVFEVKITVVGGQNTTTSQSSIAASLVSDAKAGDKMEVSATIRNLGTSSSTFVVGVKNYESWASLDSISERIITLKSGESKDVSITFDVNKDASGEQTFTLETQSNGKLESKEVSVEIAGSSFFSSLANSLGSNYLLWIIGIINVILIILIIYIAVRLFRR